ncbi:ATP-grasp domain-containing protein [Kitasatospora sp. NPDC006697]|uniref:ATP-grasp domain-containing protein n=1 Tax=Kitasatospora sp. NPDC006697 TaxID=3364020 RepID=UPI0036A14C47
MTGESAAHVVVGCGLGMLGEFDKMLPAGSVTVVEESDLLDAGDLRAKAGACACVAEVVDGPAQRADGAPPPALPVFARTVAVVPASEYAVVAAAAYAEAAGVPGAGVPAARALRDKVRLRQAAEAAGLAQPRWAQAADLADLRAFAAAYQGVCVLKPAELQASSGVRRLGPADDLAAAWAATLEADDAKLRSSQWRPGRYLVEERLLGPEVSAEVLVSAGEIIWINVTDKSVWPGTHPVEAGHLLPSALDPRIHAGVVAANRALIEAVGFGTGALHSEWILVDGERPHLVECAGRLPGDALVPLIDVAYGGSLLTDYLAVLRGERPERPEQAEHGAAIRFVAAPRGVLRAVHGLAEANAVEGVFGAYATVAPGAPVGPPTSSRDRSGHVLAYGTDGPAAAAIADKAAALISFELAD